MKEKDRKRGELGIFCSQAGRPEEQFLFGPDALFLLRGLGGLTSRPL